MDPVQTIDPATGLPLPPDAIVRVLHITPKVHVYALPPSSLSTSYTAASWTALPQNPIFTARLRVLETTLEDSPDSDSATTKVDILLEQPADASLFAAAPFTATAIVTPCTDSSRFFALRIQDPTSKAKATIGIGFEERSEAFDFGVVLQESAKHLGFHESSNSAETKKAAAKPKEEKKDYSLKEGETITVNLGNTKFGRRIRAASVAKQEEEEKPAEGTSLNSFALPPPPGSGSGSGSGSSSFLPPPPNTREVRAQKRLSAQQMGFDDGQFGEFA